MCPGGIFCRAENRPLPLLPRIETINAIGMPEGHRANGPAVDARRGDAGEKTAVEAVVAAVDGLPAERGVELQISAGNIPIRGSLRALCRKASLQDCFQENDWLDPAGSISYLFCITPAYF